MKNKRIYTHHGMTGTKIHEVWKEMNRRCRGTSKHSIKNYKDKGIKVCKDWKSAKVFIEWALSNGYKEGLQIDRINNNSGYSPENCRWVTPKQNANNKCNTIFIEMNGIKRPIQEWAEHVGINGHTLHTRLIRGWSIERLLTTKVTKKRI